MENFFDDKGNLTIWARRVMMDLTYGLDQLMSSDTVASMTENELQNLASCLANMMADAVSKKISQKLQQKSAFAEMTDQEFEQYLKDKYGTIWQFVSLTEEEFARVPTLTEEQIVFAIKKGREARRIIEEVHSHINPGLRFS